MCMADTQCSVQYMNQYRILTVQTVLSICAIPLHCIITHVAMD